MVTQLRELLVRQAKKEDLRQLASLIHFEPHVHRHLDWRSPLDWIGHQPYFLAQQDDELVAALACPPDPPNVAWIRLFVVASQISLTRVWEQLWPRALRMLEDSGRPLQVAAIPLQRWFRTLLENSHFTSPHRVVVLSWRGCEMPAAKPQSAMIIRPMNLGDLPAIEQVDSMAFGDVWQNSRSCLEIAYQQAAIATVAELEHKIIGYQISTSTTLGGHLARLAVSPEYQGEGVGYTLLNDMLSQFQRRGAYSVSVNTQHDNLISLHLYEKAGFKRTGEEYPLYRFGINT